MVPRMEDIDEDSSSLVLGPSSDLHWCSIGNSVHRSLRKDDRTDIDEAGRKVKVATYTGAMLRASVVACTINPIKS